MLAGLDTGRNVYANLLLPVKVKGSVTNALASFVGSLGGGKSFANNLIVYYAIALWGTSID